MKTIVFVTNNYHPYTGGVVRSIDSFAHELRKRGYRVYIVTLDFTGNPSHDPEWVIRLWCPIRFRYKRNHMAIPWRPYAQLKDIFARLKPDVVHVHHPFLLGYKAAHIAKKMAIHTVFTYHTLYEAYTHYVPLPQSWVKTYVRAASISFCNSVDQVIAPSSAIREYLIKYGVHTSIAIIPSPLRPSLLHTNQPHKSSLDRFRLLYVGRFTAEKNLHTLLDMFKKLPENQYTLTMIGYGYEEDMLKAYAYETLGFTEYEVRFIRKPVQQAIEHAYIKADLFVFTSHTDTQGIVLAEAMAGGTPVVALDGPGQRDIVKQGENGFIVADEAEMVAAIEQIRADRELWGQMQKLAWKTAQEYTPAACTDRLITVY